RNVFVKQNLRAPRAMFPREARGLDYLREAAALRVPEVLAVSDESGDSPAFLVLEFLNPGRQRSDFDETLGRGLAALHRFGSAGFGLDHDNFIGSLPQRNRSRPSWPEFYKSERLQPLVERALAKGLAERKLASRFERL